MERDLPERLYHYTNLETLALILENQTIRFTPLINLDDPQENMFADIPNFGRFLYASCWTNDSRESIPMWNMYASLDNGVRISLPLQPFMTALPTTDESEFPEDTPVFAGRCKTSGRTVITNNYSRLSSIIGPLECLRITYTDDASLLIPQLISSSEDGESISLNALGRYKNRHWEFQREWRYQISALILAELTDEYDANAIFNRFKRARTGEPVDMPAHIDMGIHPDSLAQMEIVLSPKMSQGDRLIARALLEKRQSGMLVKSELEGLL